MVSSPQRTFAELDQPAVEPASSGLEEISQRNETGNAWTLVLDDDPTGTQTVSDVPILTADWSEEQLFLASQDRSRMTFALTNSRSLDASAAVQLTSHIVSTAAVVARRRGIRLRVVSRSDSTLRGHFAAETSAAHAALRAAGCPAHGTVFVPAFLEANRITAQDVQWVQTGTGFVPAALTEFARDASFGYTEVDLVDWVVARSGPNDAPPPTTISLEDLRVTAGRSQVSDRLSSLADGQTVVANATRSEDLEYLMLGLLDAEERGRNLVIRSGPSFVRLCAGQPPSRAFLAANIPFPAAASAHGLVVVGSHTDITNRQVDHARSHHGFRLIDLDAGLVVAAGADRDAEVQRCANEVTEALDHVGVMLRTSRDLVTDNHLAPLEVAATVADAVVSVVRDVMSRTMPRFLVAKGGITSSDLAVRALGVRRATVLGQMLPGLIPLWALQDGLAPQLPYVVFPGNVGIDETLTRVLDVISTSPPKPHTSTNEVLR